VYLLLPGFVAEGFAILIVGSEMALGSATCRVAKHGYGPIASSDGTEKFDQPGEEFVLLSPCLASVRPRTLFHRLSASRESS